MSSEPSLTKLDEIGEPYIDDFGYYRDSASGKLIHRIVWEAANSEIPDGFIVHHINGKKLDNAVDNLIAMPIEVHETLHRMAKYWKCKLPSRNAIVQLWKAKEGEPFTLDWPELTEAMDRRRYEKTLNN